MIVLASTASAWTIYGTLFLAVLTGVGGLVISLRKDKREAANQTSAIVAQLDKQLVDRIAAFEVREKVMLDDQARYRAELRSDLDETREALSATRHELETTREELRLTNVRVTELVAELARERDARVSAQTELESLRVESTAWHSHSCNPLPEQGGL